jgi:hypothetical protein
MTSVKKQRAYKILCQTRKTALETHRILCEAYSNEALGKKKTTSKWHKGIQSGRTLADHDDERLGWSITLRNDSLITWVQDIIHAYHWLTVQEVQEETGTSVDSYHAILTEDVVMHWFSAKFVPKLLTEDQRIQHISVLKDYLHWANGKMSLQMRLGFMGMMEQDNSHLYGRVLIELQKPTTFESENKCWSFFIDWLIAALIMSSFQQARQLMELIIWKFWGVWLMQYGEGSRMLAKL